MPRKRKHTRRTPRANPRGVFVSSASRHAFVRTPEGEFFVSPSLSRGALDGDFVEVAVVHPRTSSRSGGSSARSRAGGFEQPAARVVRVIDRAHETIVGRYEVADPFGVVVPHDARISFDVFTMRRDYPDIEDGSLVRVRITEFPTRHQAATGVIEEVIGRADDARMGVEVIIARHKLETRFSAAASEQVRAACVDADGALRDGYRDLRNRFVFTIDPADARDFDDALSLEVVEPGRMWRLGIHIADVSHYVPWNSSVDLDARRRATSVYLVDRVIPMLPHELCDDVCSLVPEVDRRTMTVEVCLDAQAHVVSYDIFPALIRSNARLSYEEALRIIEQGDENDSLCARLRACSGIARMLARARARKGALDFLVPEAKMVLDADGAPLDIVLRTKNEATELVEQAMILANEVVASHLEQAGFPCVFRVHERPAADALSELAAVFQEFSWFTAQDAQGLAAGNPQVIRHLLEVSRGRAEGELVSSLLLRAMKRAVYRPANEGHFGLASEAYCHFTSPIRRYPDLVVHRMLKALATKRPEKFDQEVSALGWICEHSSDMERVAEAAARESQELKMVEYLAGSVGTSFPGVVSGVASYGIYVRLECTAEGLVPVRALGAEYFSFDPQRRMLTGEDSGVTYRLGQRVAVTLKAAQPETGKLEFSLAGSRR